MSLILANSGAQAQQISADRPGVGSAPDVVPPFTLQADVGTDNQEIRLGIVKGFEIDRDDSSWSAKLALVDSPKLKLAVKASYDNQLHTVIETPANLAVNTAFSLGATVIWSRAMQTYAGSVSFTPTTRLTISPTLYYESHTRAAIFAAWVLPGHDNWQLDIGYDQHRVSAGISTALNFAHLLGKR